MTVVFLQVQAFRLMQSVYDDVLQDHLKADVEHMLRMLMAEGSEMTHR